MSLSKMLAEAFSSLSVEPEPEAEADVDEDGGNVYDGDEEYLSAAGPAPTATSLMAMRTPPITPPVTPPIVRVEPARRRNSVGSLQRDQLRGGEISGDRGLGGKTPEHKTARGTTPGGTTSGGEIRTEEIPQCKHDTQIPTDGVPPASAADGRQGPGMGSAVGVGAREGGGGKGGGGQENGVIFRGHPGAECGGAVAVGMTQAWTAVAEQTAPTRESEWRAERAEKATRAAAGRAEAAARAAVLEEESQARRRKEEVEDEERDKEAFHEALRNKAHDGLVDQARVAAHQLLHPPTPHCATAVRPTHPMPQPYFGRRLLCLHPA